MEWTIVDVNKFKKGLSDEQKMQWLTTANAARNECRVGGGNALECDISAIKIANSKFSDSDAVFSKNDDNVEHTPGMDISHRYRFSFQEATVSTDYQMVLPVGVFYSAWYGEIIITESFVEAMVENWRSKVLGERQPFIDTMHDRGAANGWIDDLKASSDGLYAKIRWTPQGLRSVSDELFKYFSADIGEITNIDDGSSVYPVLIAVALCNTPVMNTLQPAHLSEPNQVFNPAHGDREQSTEGVELMKLSEVLAFLTTAEKADKDAVVRELGLSEVHGQNAQLTERVRTLEGEKVVLSETVANLTAQVEAQRNAALSERQKKVIGEALAGGKILPKDKEKWDKRFSENPDFTEQVLADLPTMVDFKQHGDSGKDLDGSQLSEKEQVEANQAIGLRLPKVKEE